MKTETLAYLNSGIKKIPLKELGSDEILISVIAAGINKLDIDLLKNKIVEVAGLEIAGIVLNTGKNVTRFKRGDHVMSLMCDGGFAEFAIANEKTTLKIPNKLDFIKAAALPEALYTAWFNIFMIANAKQTDCIMIQGATGAIGLHAALLCKAMKLKTFVSTGHSEKKHLLKKFNFEGIFSYDDPAWEHIFSKESNGLDIVFDILGPTAFPSYFNILNSKGRIVMIDALLGDVNRIDVGDMFTKEISITASLLRPQEIEVKDKIREQIHINVFPHIEDGTFEPIIGKTFLGLQSINDAFIEYQSGRIFGKTIVKIKDE